MGMLVHPAPAPVHGDAHACLPQHAGELRRSELGFGELDFLGGGGWESNPPPAFGGPLVLKTREATRPQSPPSHQNGMEGGGPPLWFSQAPGQMVIR